MSQILVVNAGSSSLKYALFEYADSPRADDSDSPRRLTSGLVERIGDGSGPPDHAAAVDAMHADLERGGYPLDDLAAVGHRVVHGADRYTTATLIDDGVEAVIDELSALAPLHNPVNLRVIRLLRSSYPGVPHVAVFDTAFHATIPPEAATYAVPRDLAARHQIRRWGFQGTSDRYVMGRAAEFLGVPVDQVRLIVCHIGNGASITAIRDGRSVDTSMGMTPLEGLVMGTRSGDLDPALVSYLVRVEGISADEVEQLLNKRSGLLGLSGESDVREVRRLARAGDAAAALALEVHAYRLRKYVGAYLAVVPDLHAVVFTAGVGEHDPATRRAVIGPLGHLGLRLDDEANEATTAPDQPVRVSPASSPVAVLVIPTDEELEIATQVAHLL